MIINDAAGLTRVLNDCRVIAVVGVSANASRPSHYCAQYLMDRGYTVIPVNPGLREVLGVTCYPMLAEIPHKVDMVNVFRRPEDVLPIAEEAIRIGARCLWLQLGIINEEAMDLASQAGLDVVADHCIKIEHSRLLAR